MLHLESGSFFRPIASESRGRGKSGFRPFCVLLDEVHEHPTDAMVEFTRKNLKGRPNALALMITNSGVNDAGSVCLRYHDYSAQVMNGTEDDTFFAYVCGLDQGDSWTDENVWKKSAPLLDISVPKSYLQSEVRESLGMPSRQALTRRLNFCEWVDTAAPFVDPYIWAKGSQPPDMAELEGLSCWGGLDLSEKNDLSALVLYFENGAVLPFFWTPQDGLRQREERDRAPYQQWVSDGHLIAVPGAFIDYRWIAQTVGPLANRYHIESVAFDPWGIDRLIRAFDDEGIQLTLVPHGQGFRDMSASVQALEDALLAEDSLRHGNHPVLTHCINNAQVEKDGAGNRKFTKRKSTGRIDGAVALAMAAGLAAHHEEPEFQLFSLG
jgi:phage terminase large subunit-like protein